MRLGGVRGLSKIVTVEDILDGYNAGRELSAVAGVFRLWGSLRVTQICQDSNVDRFSRHPRPVERPEAWLGLPHLSLSSPLKRYRLAAHSFNM